MMGIKRFKKKKKSNNSKQNYKTEKFNLKVSKTIINPQKNDRERERERVITFLFL